MGRPSGAEDAARVSPVTASSAPRRPPFSIVTLHDIEEHAPGLDSAETAQLRTARRFGATGSLLMALGSLGSGANPVLQNPLQGVRVLGLPARMPSTALAITLTGMIMVVAAWLVIGRFARGSAPRRMTRSQLDRTMVLWALPLCLAPPMFSKDVYSYLAQSEIAARGLDPYVLGPAQALGVGNVLTRTVPTIWRDTPAPYGPLFLWLGRGIAHIAGTSILGGIFLHRLLALLGVAFIVWAVARLARRCGVSSVAALWLGALNPLVLFHLVSGIHNEALMIGLMLGFVGMALARRWGSGLRAILTAGAVLAASTVVVFVVIGEASGLGFGWTKTLGTANAVRSWMSMSTLAGMFTGLVGKLLGLGDHTSAILTFTRLIGALIAAYVGVRMLLAVLRGRVHAMGGLGITLGAVVVLFPVVHPWYLLWALIPLASWASAPAYRRIAVAVSAVIALLLMPSGGDIAPFVIVQAAIAAILAALTAMVLVRRSLPWRDYLRPAEYATAAPAYAGPP